MNGINEKSKQAQDNNTADFFLAIGYVFDDEVICQLSCLDGAAQRFALPALGRAAGRRPMWKMIRRRKMLGISPDSPASGARFVRRFFILELP